MKVHFDENLFDAVDRGLDAANALDLPERCNINLEQDSRQVAGIQLADLAAHTCAIMLAESLGFVRKTVKAGDNSGYDPDLDINIGFELWSSVRYNFLSEQPPPPDEWIEGDLQPMANVSALRSCTCPCPAVRSCDEAREIGLARCI